MPDDQSSVSIWKVSRRGLGERHLNSGYSAAEFPGKSGQRPDGCAYFSKDRWIAALFAQPRLTGYENFIIEIQVPVDIYEQRYRQFEHEVVFGGRTGTELAIPAEELDELNRVSVRLRVDEESAHGQ
jgi:hypothetical protein